VPIQNEQSRVTDKTKINKNITEYVLDTTMQRQIT